MPARGWRRARGLIVAGVATAVLGSSLAIGAGTVGAAPGGPVVQAPSASVVGLRQGAQGSNVRALQRALIAAGVSVAGGADGIFGPATTAAVRRFQGLRGLQVSGEVDAATASALGLGGSSSSDLVGLALGASGPAVRTLQRRLLEVSGYLPGGVDGVYGSGTQMAVSMFQRWHGLTVTGTVTRAVVKALDAASGGSGGGAAQGITSTTPAATSSGASSNGHIGLKQGNRGELVKALQRALLSAGVPVVGGADGVFGPGTTAALKQYQRAHGRSATGVVSADDATSLGLGTAERTPAPKASSPYEGLSYGATGDAVKELQRALQRAGVTVRGGADGVFGSATKTAVQTFQRWNGLTASGRVDGPTAAKLADTSAGGGSTTGDASSGYAGLKVGSRGDKVKALQRALLDTGLTVRGGADGVFGPATEAALIAFQGVNGLAKTGVLSARGAQILGLGTSGGPQGFVGVAGYPSFGEHSERVATLQRKLLSAGISVPGGADGMFGGSTAGAVMTFQRRAGLPVTGKVDSRTAAKLGLAAAAAPAPVSTAGIAFEVFPVQGRCYFGDTWHAPRGGGRTHLGVDIIAAQGNLLYAVVDGRISKIYQDHPGSRAGNGLRLQRPSDGTYFTYLHLLKFAPGIKVGTKVKAGDVIGYVGSTGNSATPHLHLEVHPYGGAAINPYPIAKAADACHVTAPRR